MPHVQQQKKNKQRSGQFSKPDILKAMRPAFPRDDISEAFAGSENNGPTDSVKSQKHSTNVKSRQNEKSKHKTPIR